MRELSQVPPVVRSTRVVSLGTSVRPVGAWVRRRHPLRGGNVGDALRTSVHATPGGLRVVELCQAPPIGVSIGIRPADGLSMEIRSPTMDGPDRLRLAVTE